VRVSYFYNLTIPSREAALIQILNTCRALAATGVPTTVFTRELRGDPSDCLAFYGLDSHPNFAIRPFFSRPEWRLFPPWALTRMLAGHNPDEPHIIMSRGQTALTVASWLRRMREREALFVYEAHRLCFAHHVERRSGRPWDESVPLSRRVRRIYDRESATAGGAHGIVCLTDGVRETLTRLFKITRPIIVLPSGTAITENGATARAREPDIDVIYTGKLLARKGVPLLIAAMRHLPGRKLCIVGGLLNEVLASRNLSRDHEVESRIDFTGFVEPWRVRDYLARARVGVCPLESEASIISERFTSPLKLLEMMAQGIPVVASDLAVIRAIVTHRESALLVRPGDPVALAAGIRTLLEDRALAQRLAAAARIRAMAFSWSERARRLREFFEAVAELRRSSAGTMKRKYG
jgi:glycosyltransferase involved in cell wall biosynthesis